MSLSVGVVGAGKVGTKHARILASMRDVTVDSVVDRDENRAVAVAERVDADVTTVDGALDADILFVCTPDDAHVDVVRRSLDAGCNTFVEKPLATDLDDARSLSAAADAADGVHMVGHVLRFDPRYRGVYEAIRGGGFGDVVSVLTTRLVKRERVRRTGDVSTAMRLGVHDFDLLEWLTGSRIRSVDATAATGRLGAEGYDVDDVVAVTARLTGNATASMNMGFCLPDGHPSATIRTTVVGTGETVELNASGDDVSRWGGESGSTVDVHLWPEFDGTPGGALAVEDRAFVEAVRDDDPSPVPFADGARAVATAAATEASLRRGTRTEVDEAGRTE